MHKKIFQCKNIDFLFLYNFSTFHTKKYSRIYTFLMAVYVLIVCECVIVITFKAEVTYKNQKANMNEKI